MTTSFRARFEDGKLVPQEPVDLPGDQVLEVEVRAPELKSVDADAPDPTDSAKPALLGLLERLDALPQNPDSPRDGAAQHDHYLYGLPKREKPCFW